MPQCRQVEGTDEVAKDTQLEGASDLPGILQILGSILGMCAQVLKNPSVAAAPGLKQLPWDVESSRHLPVGREWCPHEPISGQHRAMT